MNQENILYHGLNLKKKVDTLEHNHFRLLHKEFRDKCSNTYESSTTTQKFSKTEKKNII